MIDHLPIDWPFAGRTLTVEGKRFRLHGPRTDTYRKPDKALIFIPTTSKRHNPKRPAPPATERTVLV